MDTPVYNVPLLCTGRPARSNLAESLLTAGQPITAHRGVPERVVVAGSDDAKRHGFIDAMNPLRRRLCMFVRLPFDKLDRMKLQQASAEIGKTA